MAWVAYFMEFAVTLSRCYGRKMESQPEQGNIDKMSLLASHLERHCYEPMTCKDMARIACLSERQLRRVFASCYQMSPIEYLLNLRIQHAAALLVLTDKTISEIAFSSGFHENSYFCRQFRQKKGMSPMEFRLQGRHDVQL